MAGLIDRDTKQSLILRSSSLSVNIDGFVYSILASLTYFNQLDHEVDGVFIYSDSGAVVTDLQVTVGNRKISMEVRDLIFERNSAENSPCLEGKTDENFEIGIGRIQPNVKVSLEVCVLGELQTVGEALCYKTTRDFTPLLGNCALERTDMNQCNAVKPYAFDINIRTSMPCLLAGCFSRTHVIQVDADANAINAETVVITLAEKYKFDREIEVFFYPSQSLGPYVAIEVGKCLSSRAKELPCNSADFSNDAIVAVSFVPDLPTRSVYGEFVFMVDRSGSMSGSHIRATNEALVLFLKSLPTTVHFNVVSYGSYSRSLFPSSQLYNQENVEKGCAYVSTIRADMGGSELLQPLKVVMGQPLATGCTRNIFLLTDGDISHPETILEYLRLSSPRTIIFAFGIGPKISHRTISNIANAGRGKAYFASAGTNIQTKIVECLKETLKPTLCNVKVDWELPESFHIRRCCQEIPFALHGQRSNLFASFTLPSRARNSVKDSSFIPECVKEFWFDEDFDSCQLGANILLEDPFNDDDFRGDWDSDVDTDIYSQCSDYKPLVDESEEYSSGAEIYGREAESEENGSGSIEYPEVIPERQQSRILRNDFHDHANNDGSTTNSRSDSDVDTNCCVSSSTAEKIHIRYRKDGDSTSSDDINCTVNNTKINNINYSNHCSDLDNVNLVNTKTYDSENTTNKANPQTTTITQTKEKKSIPRNENIDSLPDMSENRERIHERDITAFPHENVTRNFECLTPQLKSSSFNNSQPKLPDLYDMPQTDLNPSLDDEECIEDQAHSDSTSEKNQSSLQFLETFALNPGSKSPSRLPENSEKCSEGDTDCDHQVSGCYLCEWGSVNVTGFLGLEVYRQRIPFLLKSTSSVAHRRDLHKMAALKFIRSLETNLIGVPGDDVIENEIIELSKSFRLPSKFTARITADEQGSVVSTTQNLFSSSVLRERRLFPFPNMHRHSTRSTHANDEPPAVLISCPSVDEDPRNFSKRRHRSFGEADNLSDEDGKYYRLERLAPEGCDQAMAKNETTGRHQRKRLVDCRNLPIKTIESRKLVSARLTLLTRKMKSAQKLNVFAGPPFIRLILLQAAEGSWQLTYAFAKIVGLPLVQLELAAPFADCTMISLGEMDDQSGIDGYYDCLALWATAVALVYLERKWKNREDEWGLAGKKAESWLKNQTLPQGFNYLDVMLAARQATILLEQKYRLRAKSEPVGPNR